MKSKQHTLVLLIAMLVLVGQARTASDGATEEVKAPRESQRGVMVRDGYVVRRWTFYLDTDEWTIVGKNTKGPYMCHKMLCSEDFGKTQWHWSAPPKFLAALSHARGGRLVIRRGFFEIVKAGESSFPNGMPFDVSIESGADGMKIQQFGLVEFGDFALTHVLELDTTGNWTMESGRPADTATLYHVLSTASRMLIRGGYYRGNETAYLKSVELVEPRSLGAEEDGKERGRASSPDAVADAAVCGSASANGQCISSPESTKPRRLTANREQGDTLLSSEKGALERALREREARGKPSMGTQKRQVSGRPHAGADTTVAVSENESTVASKLGSGRSERERQAMSERARKQQVKAEMQARRLGLSVARAREPTEELEGNDDDSLTARGSSATVNGRRMTGVFEDFEASGDSGAADSGATVTSVNGKWSSSGALSCSPDARGRADRAVQDLRLAASERGLPLHACLVGTEAAFGLSNRDVVYVSNGAQPQVLSLTQVESVSTDSQGAIIILGADPSDGIDEGMRPVLLRGCQMSAFDLDEMAAFFEHVQHLVADTDIS